ncbi:FAD-binding oxidoreductase [Glutamicibacter protophormiae]|uniref:FAD-binding oxidoreductase n=1 Tax=Glutamicibacter protophormiae TaxID=37930 RepID=UPI00195A1413|nr:FAD-linked oxidase C-terminal domain-containing protein [Glutamicibacter protophormiae]QRQ78171.1 FAD-binding protein [Glutamicibacter protophormiae]
MHATTPTAPPTNELQDIFGDRMVTGGAELDRVSRDESRAMPEGAALAAVFPESTEEVSAALGWANRHGVKVSVRGTGTGVSGGALAYAGGLVVSLERMNRIKLIDPVNRLAEVQAGVINAELDRAAEDHGLFFAPDPASAEISTIGGNIATNAGGLRCISHGVTRDSVAALEVVLADGSILRTGARTRKNVVGLDLTSLFVGSEGTLGVITSATVRLKPIAPGIPRTFRASFPTVEDAGRAVTAIVNGAQTPEVLELLDARSVQIIEAYKPSGLPEDGCALLIGQFTGLQAKQAAGDTAQLCREHGAREVVIAEGDSLLEARRLANPALNAQGLRVSCDVAVPVGELAAVFRGIEQIAEQHGRTISVVAHAGDGNLHPTVEAEDTPQGHAAAEVVIGDITRLALELGGTISGEHGIGLVKQAELPWQLDDATLHAQQMIKYALDRKNILTPGRGI